MHPEAPFAWTVESEEAALLVALGQRSETEIAARLNVDRKTLYRWRQHPEFQAVVREHQEAFREAARSEGIAVREHRLRSQNDRWQLLLQVIRERGVSQEMQGVAGGHTGLLCRDVKVVGKGEFAREVEVFKVDCGLLRELRELEELAARELGQRVEKLDVSQSGELVIRVEYADADDPAAEGAPGPGAGPLGSPAI